ncbi:MAG: hypothetical protein Q9220_005189 [cf. Caloplaca sp. 1 TL-2023]
MPTIAKGLGRTTDDAPAASHLKHNLHGVLSEASQAGRPTLTHLNADTAWLLSIPYPSGESRPPGRLLFNILIDPWFQGSQSDFASWFSQQWHVVPPSVQTIAELNICLRDAETSLSDTLSRTCESSSGGSNHDNAPKISSYIDLVLISHEYTDHCNKATLNDVPPSTPVFATKVAARLISSWNHFRNVRTVATISKGHYSWNDVSTASLPSWLGIARITVPRDVQYFHSALLIAFKQSLCASDGLPEGIVYTPHGINANALKALSLAAPQVNVLALLHGLHDIKLSVKQLNLGAHNALRAQRITKAKYWVSTHDEVKKAGGLVNHFLKRKILTIEDVLGEERKRNGHVENGSPMADLQEVRFANLESGESLILK